MLTSLSTADPIEDVNSPSVALLHPVKEVRLVTESRVLAHRQLVRRIAWHVHTRMSGAIEVDDLIQIGLIALVEAARVFEDRGVAFSSYATTRIRGAMIDALRRDAPISRNGMRNRRKLAAVRAELEQILMRPPSDAEIAAHMGLAGSAYREMVDSTDCIRHAAIDDTYSDHDIRFSDNAARADDLIDQSQQSAILRAHLAGLSEREQLVLSLYFVEEMNLDEIGLALSVGAARVCQIKKAALGKLRTTMEA